MITIYERKQAAAERTDRIVRECRAKADELSLSYGTLDAPMIAVGWSCGKYGLDPEEYVEKLLTLVNRAAEADLAANDEPEAAL